MREGCKFFESRTYPNGDAVRKCDLDLAPEAPWRCPDPCSAYQPRLADVNWSHGSLVTPPPPPEPEGIGNCATETVCTQVCAHVATHVVQGAKRLSSNLHYPRRRITGGVRLLWRLRRIDLSLFASLKGVCGLVLTLLEELLDPAETPRTL